MAYDPNNDTCASCLHFTADDDEEGEVGACRRYPPSYVARAHTWSFANVTADNTCGEHDSIISDDNAHPTHRH